MWVLKRHVQKFEHPKLMQENIYNFMLEIFVDLNLRFAVLNSDNLLFFMKHDMGHVDRTFVLGV